MDLIYIGFAAVFIGIIAHVRGRSGIGWFLLTPLLAFGFPSAVYFYLTSHGTGELAAKIMIIPFLYGSPIATFLLLLALGRPTPPAERSPASAKFWGEPIVPVKVDPLAAMTRGSPIPEPETRPVFDERAGSRNSSGGGIVVVALVTIVVGGAVGLAKLTDRMEVAERTDVASAPATVESGRGVLKLWQDRPAAPEMPHIVVPEPHPTAQGELLYRWATASAPLVPLGD